MEFIGRQSELDRLEQEYKKSSSFVVIYGRRRVGKTTLIKEFIKGKRAFYFLASREIESLCRKRFSEVIARTVGNPLISKVQYEDWDTLFQLIADDQPEEKKVIVIDEFPYLVKTNSAFPSVLQYTKPLFAIPANRFLFYPGHVEQRDFCDALSISPAEYALIDHPERGVCLYHCGNARYLLQVQAPEFQAKLFGNAGGR